MKKVSLLAAAMTLCATSIAHAEDCAPTPPPGCPKAFEGVFIGGSIGYGVGKGKHTYDRSGVGNRAVTHGINNKLGFNGVVGGISGGYNQRLGFLCAPKLGLGIEIDGLWGNVSGKSTNIDTVGPNQVSYTARYKNALQLRGNLFYVICEKVAPKVFLGWETAKWKQTVNAVGVNNVNFLSNSISAKKSKRHNGFLWGAGVDFLMARHVILGFEYAGSASNKKSYRATSTTGGTTDTIQGGFKPQLNTFATTLKIIY